MLSIGLRVQNKIRVSLTFVADIFAIYFDFYV